ncbi:hypothetical protein M153_2400004272 [Pseudoloma neurophilia]|uniref:Uncharacterized protein n=1 Tax=Pseudoloma neurophilia TaxID=146866 RepID=A0A0R0LYW5_9MICR|nr:hypothetical protein M153_2400004272 [Pseudoloma neurophilia]
MKILLIIKLIKMVERQDNKYALLKIKKSTMTYFLYQSQGIKKTFCLPLILSVTSLNQ